MNFDATLRRWVIDAAPVASAAYALIVLVLLVTVISLVVDILSQRSSVAATAATLEQLEGCRAPAEAHANPACLKVRHFSKERP